MKPKVNILSSNKKELQYSRELFEEQGFEVSVFTEVNPEITTAICDNQPDIILLDLFVQNSDGIELCHYFKTEKELNSFLVLYTSKLAEYILVEAYKAGADDCIVRPISDRVLIRKVEALLKRRKQHKSAKNLFTHNEISIDREAYQVTVKGHTVSLPKKEFEMLYLLMKQPNKTMTREEFYHKIWDKQSHADYRIIDVHIRKIREKIGKDNIKTIKGKGYRLS